MLIEVSLVVELLVASFVIAHELLVAVNSLVYVETTSSIEKHSTIVALKVVSAALSVKYPNMLFVVAAENCFVTLIASLLFLRSWSPMLTLSMALQEFHACKLLST